MTLTVTQLGAGWSTTSPTTSNTVDNSGGSFTFTSGKWYLCAVVQGSTSTSLTNPTLSGATSGSWTRRGPASFNTVATPQYRLNWFHVKAASTFSETLTLAWVANVPGSVAVVICESNSDAAGSFFVQGTSGTGNAGTTATPTALAAFADATNNGTLLIVGLNTTSAVTAGTGVDAVAAQSEVSPNTRVAVLFRAGQTLAPTATFSSSDWGCLAAEITKDSGGGATLKFARTRSGLGTRSGSRQIG